MKPAKSVYLLNSFYFFVLAILFFWPLFFLVDAWIFPNLMKQGDVVKALFFILGGHIIGMFGPAIASILILKFVVKEKLTVWRWSQPEYYLYVMALPIMSGKSHA